MAIAGHALFALCTLLGLLSVFPGDYRVTAPAYIEGEIRQLLLAPQSGYVKEAMARAGERVAKGELIASLDDRDLALEYQIKLSARNKIEKEYQEALAIIRAGRDMLAHRPRADMPGFRLASPTEVAQEAKYEARLATESVMRESIVKGEKRYEAPPAGGQ